MKNICIILIAFVLTTGYSSCSSKSRGQKAAEEVLSKPAPQAKELMNKYSQELSGQDYIDFYETLKDRGI